MVDGMKKIVIAGNFSSVLINFRKELVLELVSQGYDVYCLAYGFTEKEKTLIKQWNATPITSTLNPNGVNPIKDIKAIYATYKIFKQIQPDIVLNTFIKPVIFCTVAAKLAKVPKVVGMIEGLGNAFTAHKTGQSFKAKLVKYVQILLYKLSLPLLNHLVVLNKDDKKDLVDTYQINVKKLTVLGGVGVDLKRYPYSPPELNNRLSFIFIARLVKEKGIFEYLEAAEKIKRSYPYTEFIVLGASDKDNPFSLSEKDLSYYVDNQIIRYLGHIDNVPEAIAQSSVFVLPSYYREGVPRSTQEAMSIGRAVITTDSPGCRDTVVNGVNGFLVEPYSSQAVADKMLYFIQNPDAVLSMGIESRKIAEDRFDIHQVNKKIISILLG